MQTLYSNQFGAARALTAIIGEPVRLGAYLDRGGGDAGWPLLSPDATPDKATVSAWSPPPPEPPAPVSAADIAKQYEGANQAANQIVYLLMARVSMALVGLKLRMLNGDVITPDNVNAEGTRFVTTHKAPLDIFKDSGRHPDAGDALYASIMGQPSLDLYPWLKNEVVSNIFATTIPRNV